MTSILFLTFGYLELPRVANLYYCVLITDVTIWFYTFFTLKKGLNICWVIATSLCVYNLAQQATSLLHIKGIIIYNAHIYSDAHEMRAHKLCQLVCEMDSCSYHDLRVITMIHWIIFSCDKNHWLRQKGKHFADNYLVKIEKWSPVQSLKESLWLTRNTCPYNLSSFKESLVDICAWCFT